MEDTAAWLRLSVSPGIGARRVHRLLEQFDGPAEILRAKPGALRAAGLEDDAVAALRAPDEDAVNRALEWLQAGADRHLITVRDALYPSRLRQLQDAPPLLFLRGLPEFLDDPLIAIVGSRNPSPTGRDNAYDFSSFLSRCGLGIVSGLALGIDGQAHRAALENGAPTVAVCATGLDQIYPPQHRGLAEDITRAGVLVSEFFPGTPPRRENFPRRNRIISGLSIGLLVVEAGLRSGSLISARLAGEQGREVFAIPGSIHNPMSRGCHLLIKQGAKLVESGQDILGELAGLIDLRDQLPPDSDTGTDEHGEDLDTEYRRFLEACGYDPFTVDELSQRTKLTSAEVSSMLLILELQGYVESGPGGRYTRVSKRS